MRLVPATCDGIVAGTSPLYVPTFTVSFVVCNKGFSDRESRFSWFWRASVILSVNFNRREEGTEFRVALVFLAKQQSNANIPD